MGGVGVYPCGHVMAAAGHTLFTHTLIPREKPLEMPQRQCKKKPHSAWKKLTQTLEDVMSSSKVKHSYNYGAGVQVFRVCV